MTKIADLDQGKTYDLKLKHGESDRELKNAKVRSIQPYKDAVNNPSDEVRYEATGTLDGVEMTIGIAPENLVSAKESKEAKQ